MRELRELEMRQVMRDLGTLPAEREPDLATRLFLDLSAGGWPEHGLGHVAHNEHAPSGSAGSNPRAAALPSRMPGCPRG